MGIEYDLEKITNYEWLSMEIDNTYSAAEIKEAADKLGITEEHVMAKKSQYLIVELLEG